MVRLSGKGMQPRFRTSGWERRASRNNAAHQGVLAPKRQPRRKKQFTRKVESALTLLSEKKYWPTSLTATTVDFTGFTTDITAGIVVGDSDVTRDGDQIRTRSFEINYGFTAGDSANICRIIVYIWKPTSTPVLANVLGYGSGTAVAPLSPYDHDRRQDFYVLYDKMHQLNASSNTATISRKVLIFKIPSFLRKAQFVNSTAVGTNHIYVGFVSDSGAATHPSVFYNAKLNFSDY